MITSQPTNQVVLEGMTASFTVTVANAASLSYQWQYDNGLYVTSLTDGGDISGSTSGTLVISNTAPADAGAYSVIVSNAAGAVASAEAFLAVFPWRPTITAQPVSQTVLAGEVGHVHRDGRWERPLFYHWLRERNEPKRRRQYLRLGFQQPDSPERLVDRRGDLLGGGGQLRWGGGQHRSGAGGHSNHRAGDHPDPAVFVHGRQ